MEKLFFGKVYDIAAIGKKINQDKNVKTLRKELLAAEDKFFKSKATDIKTTKEVEKILNYYRKLLLINLNEGYQEGIKLGFKLCEELKK